MLKKLIKIQIFKSSCLRSFINNVFTFLKVIVSFKLQFIII